MKILIGIMTVVCLVSTASKAQQPTKVLFLNLMIGIKAELNTTIDQKKSILLKSRTWTVLQPTGDSLGLVIDNKLYFIHFEQNKQYYFIVQSGNGARPVVSEKSEREFILTAAINSVTRPQ